MVPAGRLQDKLGPRVVATAGAVLCGLGLVVSSLGAADLSWPLIVGFGVLAGTGIGLGYAAATPAAVKWFGPEKKGLITGIVVAGFGLAPVYIAPLSKSLLASQGIAGAFRTLGFVFLVVAGLSAQFLVNPKPGTGPERAAAAEDEESQDGRPARRRDLAGDDPDAPLLVPLRPVRLRRDGRPHGHRPHRQDRLVPVGRGRSRRASSSSPCMAVFNAGGRVHGRPGLRHHRPGRGHGQRLPRSRPRSCSSSTSSRPRRASSSAPRSWASTTAPACRSSRRRRPTTGGPRTSA
ncbi:MAG: MFS transporter [Marinilabiliales bacterium]|nr:MFS transporter [Marinilabiliales bacterium]